MAESQPHGGDDSDVDFCSYCGRLGGDAPFRVCTSCGLGVRLRTSSRALGSESDTFLIVRADGVISAVSAAAEREIPHDEGPLLGQSLLALFTSEDDLAGVVAQAANGHPGVASLTVTPRQHGRNLRATVAPCGEPPAALVVVTRKPAATTRS